MTAKHIKVETIIRRLPTRRLLFFSNPITGPQAQLYRTLQFHRKRYVPFPYSHRVTFVPLPLFPPVTNPLTVTVPDVTGQTLALATANLSTTGYCVNATQTAFSNTIAVGSVVSQSPVAGVYPVNAIPGATIFLTLSIGPPPTFRVQAVTAGEYNGEYYEPGDVFDLLSPTDFSDSTVNYGPNSDTIQLGWMMSVPASTPLYQAEEAQIAPTYPAVDPARRFVY